jgi:HNH endonuclease
MGSKTVSPFLYPKAKHRRRLHPPIYVRYQSYKQHVRPEFEQKCIYCRRPDSFHPNDSDAFAVEHYLPKEHFPDLKCKYSNLYYACSKCNSYKGEYYPQRPEDPFFPNPCDHVMIEHVRFEQGVVETISDHGGFMVEALHLNAKELADYRGGMEALIRATENELRHLHRLEKKINKEIQAGGSTQANVDIGKVATEIVSKERLLDRLCGRTL